MIRAVVFDFNGVLADDDPIHMRAFRQVAAEEGLSFSDEEYMDRYLPLNDRDCFTELWTSRGRALASGTLDDLIRRKSVYYFQAIAERSILYEGAAEAVRAAAGHGPVAIASGARIEEIRHILNTGNLLSHFSAIVAADDVQHGKPHPEPFQRAHEQLRERWTDLKPAECVAVEDSIGGIESAHAAGMPCLAVAHSYSRDRLEGAKAEWIIESISGFGEWLSVHRNE